MPSTGRRSTTVLCRAQAQQRPRRRRLAPGEGSQGVARHGPAGARRRLRPDRLRAQPRPGGQAPHRQQRAHARHSRRAAARRLRAEPRSSSSTSTVPRTPECAGQHLHPRRRVARQPRRRLRLPGGAVRRCGRALRRARFHQCRRRGRQPVPDGRAGAARGRLGLQERASFGGDPNRLYVSPFLGLASRRLRGDDRLAQGWPARRYPQGRDCSAAACTTSSRCGSPSARNTSSSPTRWSRS